MADIQTINIGNLVNDGLGDDLRTAFQKVNANFANLDAELTLNVINAGTVGTGIFKQKVGTDLEFKRIEGGNKIALDNQADTIIINSTDPDAFIKVDTDSGSVLAATYPNITMQGIKSATSESGFKDIEVTTSGSSINFKTVIPVTDYLRTYDFGTLNGSLNNAIQLALQAANVDFGTLQYSSEIDLDCDALDV
jgi:hypothetical protein